MVTETDQQQEQHQHHQVIVILLNFCFKMRIFCFSCYVRPFCMSSIVNYHLNYIKTIVSSVNLLIFQMNYAISRYHYIFKLFLFVI